MTALPEPVDGVVRLDLAYDGSRFHGWQIQPDRRTVQGTVEAALAGLYRQPVPIHGAGRTDAGVHALAQVASCRPPDCIPLTRLARVLNARLPGDVRVVRVQPAGQGFHARKSARWKVYRYHIRLGRPPSPFESPFTLHVPGHLNCAAMGDAARQLVGRHDFRSFCAHAEPDGNTTRHLMSLRVLRRGSRVWVRAQADGFLQHMVRNLAGTLLEVGRGRMSAADMPSVLAARDRGRAGPTAPAAGLCLVRVDYGPRCVWAADF